jgi:AcrR family transcriptional regulator
MRKKDETLCATLLNDARFLADTQGIDAVNIRSLAQRAQVATGTVYNYFSNKNEILLALTDEYWAGTLHEMETTISAGPFCDQLQQIFDFLRGRIDCWAGKLMCSLGRVEPAGQQHMASAQAALEDALLARLGQDPAIRPGVWSEGFTKQEFAHFLVLHMTLLLRNKAPDIHFLIALVRRTIY